MRMQIAMGIALAVLNMPGPAPAQVPAGGVRISGTSTVGDWECRAPMTQPEPAPNAGVRGRPPVGQPPRPGVVLSFPVQAIDCGDAVMNDRLRRALQADRHPTISFALAPGEIEQAAKTGSAPAAVDGTLTIAGRTEPVRTEVTVTPSPGHAIRVTGQQSLRMSAFGVKAPSLLLGALKVRDLVRVAFDIVLRGPVGSLFRQPAAP